VTNIHPIVPSDISACPLAGVKVIEMTHWVAGPLAGMILGDLGADVLKVENPNSPDGGRGNTEAHGVNLVTDDGRYMCWETFNRNKRSIALDASTPDGQAVLHKLVADCDVFLTNLRRRPLEAMGASFEQLQKVNQRIVYAFAEGLGAVGPRANEPAVDSIGMAYSGFMFEVSAIPGVPWYPHGSIVDLQAGTMLAFAILSGLFARDRTGQAQYAHSSQLQAMMWLEMFGIAMAANTEDTFDAHKHSSPLFDAYKCRDGKYISIGILYDKTWPDLASVLESATLITDPRFSERVRRHENRVDLKEEFNTLFARRDRDEWLERLRAKGIMCSPVNTVTDLVTDEQVASEGYLVELENGLRFVKSPFGLEEIPRKGAPELGADTHEVLLALGLSIDEIVDLHIKNVVL